MPRLFLIGFLIGCAGQNGAGIEGEPEQVGGVAIPTETSSGFCPDMTASQTTSFESSGEDRVVTIVTPQEIEEEMPMVFFFHGLLDPQSTPRPTEYMASALNLQSLADDMGVLIALPQSKTLNRLGFEFFMWDVEVGGNLDLVLFDDLRACAYDQMGIDLTRVHSMGFSGGALFSTVVASERGELLASLVEISGGSDITMPTFEEPISQYETPQNTMPSLLISGGEQDQWPGGGITLVDFTVATNTLEDSLIRDGHFVVRCEHTQGHTITMDAYNAAKQWIELHQFGEPSPIQIDGLSEYSAYEGWCEVSD